MHISKLNHVAVLVNDLDSVLKNSRFQAEMTGPIETFPSEGTRECYIGLPKQSGKLLLLQPDGDGPYQRAMLKRGPGLHHIAIDVTDIQEFVDQITGTGWYLHPISLKYYKLCKQVFLARPGVNVLVEIQEQKTLQNGPLFIEQLLLDIEQFDLIDALRCENLRKHHEHVLKTAEREFKISDLIKSS
jgi:methylmalonyl-CoA/ethylmalonyl-CoA epimerase